MWIQCISWIPLNEAALSVLDVGLARDVQRQQVVHLYHPRPVPWTTIITAATEALKPVTHDTGLPLVTWSEWYSKLESCGPEDLQRVPGLKLLSFYRSLASGDAALRALDEEESSQRESLGLVKLSTVKMQTISPTLRNISPLTLEDPARWIAYWRSKGLFGESS